MKSNNTTLNQNANTNHDDGEAMYNTYGAHIDDDETNKYYCLQRIKYDWLDEDDEELMPKLLGQTESEADAKYYICSNKEVVKSLVRLARSVKADMDAISEKMDAAVAAYEAGDLELTIELLEEARYMETEHGGDDPSTSELRQSLLSE